MIISLSDVVVVVVCCRQYMFDVTKEDEVLIELTQKMQRIPGVDRETIGFTILQVFVHIKILFSNRPIGLSHES